jgi:hypothetical protein
MVFRDVISHGLVDIYQCFGRFYCHLLQEGHFLLPNKTDRIFYFRKVVNTYQTEMCQSQIPVINNNYRHENRKSHVVSICKARGI